MQKSLFLVCFLYLFAFGDAFASNVSTANATQKFDNANKFYKNGDFQSAKNLYLELTAELESSDLYYNLGNCYYRDKDFGRAILYYEKAKMLNPSDSEIEQNITITQTRLQDKFDAVPEFQLIAMIKDIRDSFNSNAWSIITIASAWLAAIMFFLFYLSQSSKLRQLSFFGFIVFLIAFSFNISMAFSRMQYEETKDKAVITNLSVYIKSEPKDSSQNIILLHSGTKLQLMEDNGDFVKVKIANGNIGWINKKDIELI